MHLNSNESLIGCDDACVVIWTTVEVKYWLNFDPFRKDLKYDALEML